MTTPVTRVLIQGASRGLGLQFCRTLLSRQPDVTVIATCRSPDSATDLQSLTSIPSYTERLQILKVDAKDESLIQEAAGTVERTLGGLDLLVNCAGILHPSGKGETSMRDVTLQDLQETCSTNAFGPLLMGKHFGKLLQNGGGMIGKQPSEDKNRHAGVLVNMSAKVGSITDNGLGGWYGYRMSKAALNMATKNLSIEMGRGRRRVVCVSLHPGTVDTALSRPYHRNVKTLFSTEDSVNKLMAVIDSLSYTDTGKFFTYDKEDLPF